MEIKNLENRRKGENKLYNLFTTVIADNKTFSVYEFVCTKRHDMRLDLVSQDIYNDTDQIDLLCIINNIMNPLTIQEGDVILFPEEDDIEELRSSDQIVEDMLEAIKTANNGKTHKNDKNRQKDLKERRKKEKAKKLLPPNILENGNTNLRTENGNIKRSPNF